MPAKARHIVGRGTLLLWLLAPGWPVDPLSAQAQRLDPLGISYSLPAGWRVTTDANEQAAMRMRLMHAVEHTPTGTKAWVWGVCLPCIRDPETRQADILDFLAVQAGNIDYQITRSSTITTMGGRTVRVAAGTTVSRTTRAQSAFVTLLIPDAGGLGLRINVLGPPEGVEAMGALVEAAARSFQSVPLPTGPRPPGWVGSWQRSANTGAGGSQGGNNTEEQWVFRPDGMYRYRYVSSTYMAGASIEPTIREGEGRWLEVTPGRLLVFPEGDGGGMLHVLRREGAMLVVDGTRFLPLR